MKQVRRSKLTKLSTLLVAAVLAGSLTNMFRADAAIVAPYSVDADTLHLWHLDESSVPAVDSAPGGTNLLVLTNGATLGDASFTGFGNALNLGVGNTNAYLAPLAYVLNSTTDDVALTYADPTTGAFTFEAVVRVDFDPATITASQLGGQPMYIVTCENDGAVNRPWQWSVIAPASAGGTLTLRFLAGGSAAPNNFSIALPTTGPDAVVQGSWYHVAVTFTGGTTSGTAKQYWTLMDSSRTQANLLGSFTMNVLNPKSSATPGFEIGNVGRGTSKQRWIGLVDEVRLSKVERSASGMMFNSLTPVVNTDPVGTTVAVGQPFTLSVGSSGVPPLFYQWRTNGTPIPNATNASYSVAAAQLSNADDYTVVVTNSSGSVTSAVATVSVRIPSSLTWLGTSTYEWETNTINWDSNGDFLADAAYAAGDHVRFDDNGGANSTLDVTTQFRPSSVVVSNDVVPYLWTTTGTGGVAGASGLTKLGSSTLTLDVDNTYSGPTVIEGGTITVGINSARGSLGTGPITNNGVLSINRTGTLTLPGGMSGSGTLIKDNTGSLLLPGANDMTGAVVHNRGNITVGSGGLGNASSLTITGVGTGNGTTLTIGGGAVISTNTAATFITSDADNRVFVVVESGSNVWNGTIVIQGTKSTGFNPSTGSIEVNGPITGPSFTEAFVLRGASNSVLNSVVTLPNAFLQKTDGNTWTVSGVGSSYLYTRMLGGTIKLGGNNTLATNGYLANESGASVLDLAGFNQTFTGLSNRVTTGVITNSGNTDSRLTIATSDAWFYGSLIAGNPLNAAKLSVTLTGGSLTLSNANTYSGDTTISGGALALVGGGALVNSTPIQLAAGATLNASSRSDSTFTVSAAQTLTGDGAFNVAGNLVNNGTIALKVGKAGATLSNDSINGISSLTYGGTLQLNITASPTLNTNDSFKLFDASSYGGTFAQILPSSPASGFSWDTSTLATDGRLRIGSGPATNATNLTFSVTGDGSSLQLSWPSDHTGWTLQTQTNSLSVGISTNWVNVVGSTSTNQVAVPINTTNGAVFYRLILP